MSRPLISIVIPVFNSALLLPGCLDSIATQSLRDFEVIIIDGGSTDISLDICRRYSERLPHLQLLSEPDNGIYDAMNKGVTLATGEWVYFLGSDDRLYHEKVLEDVIKHLTPEYDVVYGNVKVNGDEAWAIDGTIFNGAYDLEKLIGKNICHQAIFYNRRCFYSRVPAFNISYKICADWDFNLYCWSKKPFLYMDLIIALFSGGGTSTIVVGDKDFRHDMEENLTLYFGPDVLRGNNSTQSRPAKKESSGNWFKKSL